MKYLLLLLLFSINFTLFAGDVIVTWEPNSEFDIKGYKVFYGLNSGLYTDSIDVKLSTHCYISELIDSTKYFFAVSAYNDFLESEKSNEVGHLVLPKTSSLINPPKIINIINITK